VESAFADFSNSFEFNPTFVLDQPLAEIDFDPHPLHSVTPEAPLNSAST
jgi:hypothetical protein